MVFSIIIENLSFEAIIGILPFERENPQKILIDGVFGYQSETFLDYVELRDTIIKLFQTQKYFLLEDAIKHISSTLQSQYPSLTSIELSIKKPDILKDCVVGLKTKITL